MSTKTPILAPRATLGDAELKELWPVHQELRVYPDLVNDLWTAEDPVGAAPELLEELEIRRGNGCAAIP